MASVRKTGQDPFECKGPVHFSAQTRSLLALEMNLQDGLPVGGQLDQDDAGVTGHVLVLTGTTVQLDFGVVVNRELLFLLGAARFLVEFGEQSSPLFGGHLLAEGCVLAG